MFMQNDHLSSSLGQIFSSQPNEKLGRGIDRLGLEPDARPVRKQQKCRRIVIGHGAVLGNIILLSHA